jgi:acetyl coenzyme A synthetase (ADP forming)-like protein
LSSTLDAFFQPASIAVIGASRTPATIGWMIIDNLLRHGYTGAIYPVNPKARAVHGVPAFASVGAIRADIDLAVIAVPKGHVEAVAEECAACGVKAVIVISAGFKEVGGEGIEREHRLVAVTRRHGMRIVGPNCLGVVSTSADVMMNATFAPSMPPPGNVSFMSQSGAMGVTILDYAAEFGIGIHHFVSVGNKADVSGNDLIEYWEHDEGTGVMLLYLESFGNPRKFTKIARRVTRSKPILVVKAGRTAAGARAASSHTGALAGLDTATDALLSQCGVIRVDRLEELFDLAVAFSHLTPPADETVAIVTNAGGPGIIITDACEAAGLRVVELSAETQAKLRRDLPEEASVRNPVDMIATATAANYRIALETVLGDANVSSAIAAFVPPLGVRQLDVANAIIEARLAMPGKPLLAVLMGREGLPQGRAELSEAGIPAYIFPESAARALAALNRQRKWLSRPIGTVREFDVDENAAERALSAAPGPDGYLPAQAAQALLAAYGIPVIATRLAGTVDEAVAAARDVGYPVAAKIVSPDIVHKTDIGGVALDVRGDDEMRRAFDSIMSRARAASPDARLEGVQIEQFVKGGRETIIGMSHDATFGPVLMFGLGGIYVEALGDVVFCVQPVSDIDAREMLDSIRGAQLLRGVRGEPPSDTTTLVEVIQRVSQLVGERPEVLEMDINPFVVFESGGIAVDARVRLGRARG